MPRNRMAITIVIGVATPNFLHVSCYQSCRKREIARLEERNKFPYGMISLIVLIIRFFCSALYLI